MPSHFVGYHQGSPVALLMLFHMEPLEMEVIAYTDPNFRRLGWFKRLFEAAMVQVASHGVKRLLFQTENQEEAALVMDSICTKWDINHSEYRMSCVHTASADIPRLDAQIITTNTLATAASVGTGIYEGEWEDNFSFLSTIVTTDGSQAYLLHDGEEAVGICCLRMYDDCALLFGLGIKQELRGTGLGKRLLATMLDIALQSRQVVTLEVDSMNPAALALYRRLGFVEEFRTDYLGADTHDIRIGG